jgi:aspartyl-tRNA(Asn)/glutamyl-tRNA(Gln) amidotransferase subunit A
LGGLSANARASSGWLATATALRRAYASGELSPVEVMSATLERAATLGATLNAFMTIDADPAMSAADAAASELRDRGIPEDRPLFGIPVSVKDLTATAGLRTTRGSLASADHVPTADAPAVARIRRAGGIVFAKTNTSEAGWKADAGNRLIGPTSNPWDLSRSSGGSSGGAAAAVAAGIGPLGTGTDGAGSIRIPAAFCGVVGFKPTAGLIAYVPASADRLAHLGPLARSVEDAMLLTSVMAGDDDRDPFSVSKAACNLDAEPQVAARIGMSLDLGYGDPSEAAVRATREAGAALAGEGHLVAELEQGIADPYPILETLMAGAEAASYAEGFERVRPVLDPGHVAQIELGRRLTGLELAAAAERRLELNDAVHELMRDVDLLLTPTMPTGPFRLGLDGPAGSAGLSWTSFTYPFNLTGQPAITLPAGFDEDGLPLGIQLVARRFDDALLLAVARAYERARPWSEGYPALWRDLEGDAQ